MGRLDVLHNNHRTPMKSRRRLKSNPPSKTPNLTVPDHRKQTPPNRIPKKSDMAAAVATKPAAVTLAKNLAVGQVQILKRGETLEDCSTNLNKAEDDRKKINPKIEASKTEDLAVHSTRGVGPDPEMVSKQMKNVRECFAGFVFFDSPPPSSVPLPCFSKR